MKLIVYYSIYGIKICKFGDMFIPLYENVK